MSTSALLKCLECRLVGAPPVFKLAPPPAPPAEFLLNLHLNENKPLAKQLKQIQLKRCLKVKNFLNKINTSNQSNTKSSPLSSISNEHYESLQTNSLFYNLTPNQSLLIFIICFLIFLIVLTIAFVFLYKLFRLRNELKSCKKTKPTYLSSSNSQSNTISSHMIITPSSSLLSDPESNQKQFLSYNLLPLYDSASTSTNSSLSSKNTTGSSLFYNQLFESTRHLFLQNQNLISSSSNASSSSNTPASCEQQHYLQAVPNSSNLIENHLNHRLDQLKAKKAQDCARNSALPSEYDEINNQYERNYKLAEVYNQYEDLTLSKNRNSSQMIIQPIFPFRQMISQNCLAFGYSNGAQFKLNNFNDNKNLYHVC